MSELCGWLNRQHLLIRIPGWLLVIVGFPVWIYLLIWLFTALAAVCVALTIPFVIFMVVKNQIEWNRLTPELRAARKELNNVLCRRIDKQWGSTF